MPKADPGSVQTSNTVTISGINAPAPVSIAGGAYSIDGGAYTSASGSIVSGQSLTVRQTASASYSTSTTATVTVGGFAKGFTVTTRVADTTPDNFSFAAVSSANPGVEYTSNSITVTGIEVRVPISVSGGGGSYSVNNGPFTSAAGTVGINDTVVVKVIASTAFSTSATASLTVGPNVSGFKAMTRSADVSPDPIVFDSIANAPIGSVQASNEIVISGIELPVAISVTNGSYSVNGSGFGTAAGQVKQGDRLRLQLTSSSSGNSTVKATAKVGNISGTFSVQTAETGVDTTPDAFSFTPVSGAAAGSLQVSNPITVSGINAAAPISVGGGSYSIDGGAFVTASGSVTAGRVVRVALTAAAASNTAVSATLTIGGVARTFTVTTGTAADTTPDAFSFTPVTGASPGSVQTSNSISVSGINAAAPISILGGTYSINGGAFVGSSGSVVSGQSVSVRLTASSNPNTTTTATLTIGGVSRDFSVSTGAAVAATPADFSFAALTDVALSSVQLSNTVTLAGFAGSASVSITGGLYSVDGGGYTSAAGSIVSGQSITVRLTASSNYITTTTASLTVGTLTRSFNITTLSLVADTTPDSFSFGTVTNVPVASPQTSNAIVVSGINTVVPISITGGSYSIDNGVYTSATGSIGNGQMVSLRLNASSAAGTTTSATLTIGSVSATFYVTTAASIGAKLPGDTVVAMFGDSLEDHNGKSATTAGSEEYGTWSRGYYNWVRLFAPKGRWDTWWDPNFSPKYYNGQNKGISGITTANMYANRLPDLDALAGVRVMIIGGGTNDLNKDSPLYGNVPPGSSDSGITRNLRAIYDHYLALGVRLIIITPPTRPTSGTDSWPSGGSKRNAWFALCAWMQAQADADPDHIQIVRRDLITSNNDADRTPIPGYLNVDNVHLVPVGGYHVAMDPGGVNEKLANWIEPFTGQPKDSDPGEFVPNPTLTGSGGKGCSACGVFASGYTLSGDNSAVTVVGSKVPNPTGGESQVLRITRNGAGGLSKITLNVTNNITSMPAAGTWVRPWMKVKASAAAYNAISIRAREQPSSAYLDSSGMRYDSSANWPVIPLDDGAGGGVWVEGPPWQVRSGGTSIIFGAAINIDNSTAGTDTITIERIKLMQIPDPRPALGFN